MTPAAKSPVIAALTRNPRDPNRVSVIVVQKSARRMVATLSLTQCEELGLRVDRAWTPALAKRAKLAQELDAALTAALARLAKRAYSLQGLREALVRAKHSETAAEGAVQQLHSAGWMNDAAYANQRAAYLASKPMHARDGIAELLEAEGVEPAEALRAARDAAPKNPHAGLCAEAEAARAKGVSARTLAGRFARRGFDADAVQAALHDAGYAIPLE